MKNADINMVYNEIKAVRKKLEYLESILIPEEEFSETELKELDRLRKEALEEHNAGQTVKIEGL